MGLLVAAVFAPAWWLGLYLIGRHPRERGPRRAGLGLLAYAGALAVGQVREAALPLPGILTPLETALILLPAPLWAGALLTLVPGTERLDRIWSRGLVPVTVAVIGWLALSGGTGRLLAGAVLVLPLAGALALLVRAGPVRSGWLAAVATLFFTLGTALLPAQLYGPPGALAVLAIGADLLLLGVAMAMSSAFQDGEALWRDMLRSALGAVAVTAATGGQVVLVIAYGEATPALTALLYGVIAVAIAVQTAAGPVQRALDRLAFPADPAIRRERAVLRESAEALPRREDGPPPLDDAEFTRLTRRALTAYGDLGKLASSPLANLPIIDKRVTGDVPLERAAELKHLLLESIGRLKPREGEFGTSEEWRFYNVLYFPYVRGLRPYRRGASGHGLGALDRQAFDWLTREVPERTCHNWQNQAARLVAEDLRRGNWQ
ncbi:hypothetical protein [Spongiactinospora sp. TRM90649]|uniref:hypothetical protein n=1 Tax=Spongiactinospora sp. TRM90649 TaxID=3031114 RepID=UPI0023F7D11E|nr:hypothetical protein [Spongiactinospora sp. TRM90649]MDF5755297.1 hypothetical protein [Spongiactinospora sp. TRM90649]